jgi:probable DNA repair protein
MAIKRINIEQILPHLSNGATILVPNLRIKDAITAGYLDSLTTNVTPTPKIYAVDIFILECWSKNARLGVAPCANLQPLSAVEEFLVWHEIIESSLTDIPLLNPGETASVVARSYQTSRQWLNPDILNNELRENSAIKDIAVFDKWALQFKNYCEKHQRISLVDCTKELSKLLEQEKLTYFPKKTILVNFYDPPPLYEHFFSVVPQLESVLTIKQKSNQKISKVKINFSSPESELRHCVNWVKNLLAKKPSAHIGLITCNKELEQKQLEQLLADDFFSNGVFANIDDQVVFNTTSTSENLLDASIIYDGLLLLSLGQGQHNTEDICRILQSPYLSFSDEESENRFNLVTHLQIKGSSTISGRDISYLANNKEKAYSCPFFSQKLVKVRTEIRKIKNLASPLVWSEVFEAIFDVLGWPGPISSNKERRFLKQWEKLFSEFKDSSKLVAPLTYSKALAKLRLLCAQDKQRKPFDSSLALSYYTANEAIGLEFDYIRFLGLNDQQWPEPVNPSPFLPYDLQKSANIPGSHNDIQLSIAKKQFDQLIRSARVSIQASYYSTDGDQNYRPSGFIKCFLEHKTEAFQLQELSNKATRQLNTLPISIIIDESTRLEAEESLQGGANVLSDQSACPFRAFALNRLKAYSPPRLEAGLSKMARGSAIHFALEYLFAEIGSHDELINQTENQVLELCNQAAVEAIEYLSLNHRDIMTPKFQSIEQSRIKKLLRKFIQVERNRPPFQVLAREQAFTQQFDNFVLNIRIDRIDQLNDGTLALIDYKTGKYSVSPKGWMDERPKDMQLPLYHSVASASDISPIDTVSVAHLHAEKIGHSGITASDNFSHQVRSIGSQKGTEMSWNEITKSWSRKVEYLAHEFNQGVADVNPADPTTTCAYCGLQSLCRIQELSSNKLNKITNAINDDPSDQVS